MTTQTRSRIFRPTPHVVRRLALGTVVLVALAVPGAGAAAHGPDPTLSGGPFRQDQVLRFRWRAGAEPTAAIKTAIKEAASDVTSSRSSRAATFTYDAAGSNPIGYGVGATCGVNGLACFTRDAPDGFTMWLREQGHVFDWGTLKWCQAYATAPSGCYDAETITLDEFGHVEGLNHHVNYDSDSDYEDAVVQTFSRTKPSTGWNRHAFGRCDVATLQVQYDITSSAAKYSTCLDLATVLTLSTSSASIPTGGTATLTAALRIGSSSSYGRLIGNVASGRTVTLQRRAPGATTWVAVGTMPAGATAGTYVLAQRPGADTEYRAVFKTPTDEGVNGDTSPTVLVDVVVACTTTVAGDGAIAVPCA
jgi:hypothetical protein